MHIRVLGPVEVERDGELVNVGGPQQRRLLAFLVVHRGHFAPTERLVDALWGYDIAPEGARRSMRTYLSRLRSVLPDGAIARRASGYRLVSDGISLDVEEFDSLIDASASGMPDQQIGRYDEALALWRGTPFGEFSDEWWAIAESNRLIERRAAAREVRAAALMAMGHHDRAVIDLEQIVTELPLRERPVRLLMQALVVTGRRPEALRVARSFRVRLADETGLEPSQDLVQFESAVASDSDTATQADDRPLRGYTIHHAIGEGAHGRVYAATQPGTDRPVAIKVIRPSLADSTQFVRRFETEARVVARLEHPHIVPLYDYWREPGGAYLVFRLLTGGTARDSVVTGGPWSLQRVERLVEEIGAALMAAHSSGVVHNDVKASNVLLDQQGTAYLTDFGIALDALAEIADDDRCPECRDVEGLAWLVWELLTGTRPSGASASLSRVPGASSRADSCTPSLVGRISQVPDGLDALLQLASAPDAGGLSVAEFLLGWRAAVGEVDGTRALVTSSGRLVADSARRHAARELALAVAAGINPYRGLRPFDEADASRFHGRSVAVDDLVRLVNVCPFVTVAGASGSGKSSIVRAGLLPRLQAEGFLAVTMIPGEDPVGALGEALHEVTSVADVDAVDHNGPLDALFRAGRRFGRVAVVVDQFEECWTRATADARDAFVDVIVDSIRDKSVDIRFLLTIRADLLDGPLGDPRLGSLLGRGTYLVAPMSPADLDEAIALPAAHAGVHVDDAVVAELVAEAARRPGSLPLLQFALTELYDRRVDGVIGSEALKAIGGMTGAIGRRAEELYLDGDNAEQAATRDLFVRLVAPGDGSPDTRRRAQLSELSARMRIVANRFVESRLLVTDRDPTTREPTVELAHEALLERWPRLATWVEEDRRWLDQLRHLSMAARAWDASGRQDSELYRGARLEAAIEAIELDRRAVSELEREYVDAGVVARDADVVSARRTARRLRRRLSAVAVALVLALAAGAMAVLQRGDALDAADRSAASDRSAQIEALVGRVESLRSTQRDVAALLAVEAHRLAETPRARSALFGTFTDNERFLDAHHLAGDRGTSGIVMPDGASAFVTGQDGVVRHYHLATGKLGSALPAIGDGDRFPVLVDAPDGRLAVASRSDPRLGPTVVGITDPPTGRLTFEPVVVDGAVTSMTFLDDGRLALAIGEEGRLIVIDDATGHVVGAVPGVELEDDDINWTVDSTPRRASAVSVAQGDVLLGSGDGSLRILDPDTLDVRRNISLAPQTLSRLWPLDDATIVTSGRLGVARIDLETATAIWSDDEFERCINLTVVEERGVLFCGDAYGRLEQRDLATGAVQRRLDAQNGNTGSLWIASNGTELVSFGNNEPVVSRWRLDRSGPITHVVAPGWTPSDFNHSGELLLVERGDPLAETYQAAVVDVESGSTLSSMDQDLLVPGWAREDVLFGIAQSPDGVFEYATETLQGGRRGAGPVTKGAAVERNDISDLQIDTGKSKMLFRYNDDSLTALDTVSQEFGASIPVKGLVSWTSNRGGDRIAAGTSSGILIFDAATGEQVQSIPDEDLRGAFITASDQLFVSSLGGELTQYDLETLEPMQTFGGSRGLVFELTGTADGSLIAINGGDRTAALFDVASSTQIGGPITIEANERNRAILSLDGKWLAIGGMANTNDGVPAAAIDNTRGTQIWDLDPKTWEAAACRLAGRNLTREEWTTHIGDIAPYRSTCQDLPVPD